MINRSGPPVPPDKAAGPPVGGSGGFFHVRAVAQKANGEWILSSGGKTFNAKTQQPLVPGASYTGVFRRKGASLEFIPRAAARGSLPPAAAARLPQPGTAEFARFLLGRAFFQAGLPLPQGSALRETLAFVTKANRREVLSRSALAARCAARGLELSADAAESLYAVLEGSGGGRENGGQGKGSRDREEREDSPAVEGAPAENPGGDLLLLFNHIPEGEETWVVYPYRCVAEESLYAGSLRVLYGVTDKTARKYVLFVRSGEDAWHFAWNPDHGRLKIYYTGGLDTKNLLPGAWKRKFRKLGLFSDDIVYNGENFDGFCGEAEEPPEIDATA
ncbi:MAG: hypothetical protein FWG35_02535 [Spirochaetaceae bacterium]|nr:hypothetical protein [Spirochaetaceae bacterium]